MRETFERSERKGEGSGGEGRSRLGAYSYGRKDASSTLYRRVRIAELADFRNLKRLPPTSRLGSQAQLLPPLLREVKGRLRQEYYHHPPRPRYPHAQADREVYERQTQHREAASQGTRRERLTRAEGEGTWGALCEKIVSQLSERTYSEGFSSDVDRRQLTTLSLLVSAVQSSMRLGVMLYCAIGEIG